jgi:hypothetical protein
VMLWRRRRKFDERVSAAEGEVKLSRRRLEATRKNIVEPVVREGRRNQFAEIIRASLVNGYRSRSHEGG